MTELSKQIAEFLPGTQDYKSWQLPKIEAIEESIPDDDLASCIFILLWGFWRGKLFEQENQAILFSIECISLPIKPDIEEALLSKGWELSINDKIATIKQK